MSNDSGPGKAPAAPGVVVRTGQAKAGGEHVPELAVFPDIAGFRLIQELARSPKGITYKARRLVEQDVVAIKVFRDQFRRDADFRRKLERSAESSFLLEHPGLVRCLGCLEDEQRLIVLMEYARGEPVARALQRNVRFLPPRALSLALQCVEALEYAAERRRFHGRLHPGDLIVSDEEVRMLGVGLGEQPEHPGWATRDPHLFEPLMYVAPEVQPPKAFPSTDDGRRACDLYALGAVLYHMLTGVPPFRGADAAALAQERAALSPLVVRWPRGSERSLPAHGIAIVEQLLSPDPVARGDYAQLRAALSDALREAEGHPVPAPRPVVQALAPAEVVARPAPAPAAGVAQASSLHGRGRQDACATSPAPRPAVFVRHRHEERDRTPAVLIGAVAVVLAYALGLATKTFLLNQPSPPAPAPPSHRTAPGPSLPQSPPAGQSAEAVEQAARKLKLIKDLLAEGAARYDTTLLRELHDVVQKAGETSRAGLEAKLLIGEVEERLARGGEATGARLTPPSAASSAEDKVFQELLTRARELSGQQRFGDALAALGELPPGLRLAPFPERAAQECAQIEQQAKAAFAELSLAAEHATAAGDYAKARKLYQAVQLKWGMPSWLELAAARIKALGAAEEKAFQTQAALNAEKTRAQELSAFASVLRAVVPKVGSFRYAEAKDDLDKFVRGAQDPEARKLAADYAQLVQDEGALFARGRVRLQEQIQRDPNRSSPLQVLNKDRQPLYDITDFNEQGIKVTAVRGGAGGERVQEWGGLDPRQPFVMVQLLCDKGNAAERLELAALAFHQSLRAEAEAARGGGSTERTTPQKLREIAGDLKNTMESELNGAVQADVGVRDRQAAQRALMERIANLLANPPPTPDAP